MEVIDLFYSSRREEGTKFSIFLNFKDSPSYHWELHVPEELESVAGFSWYIHRLSELTDGVRIEERGDEHVLTGDIRALSIVLANLARYVERWYDPNWERPGTKK